MLKKISSALTAFLYLILIGLVFYLAWDGWYKLCTLKEQRKEDCPMTYAGMHIICLIILLLIGCCTNDSIQDMFIYEFVRWTGISGLFILIGLYFTVVLD